MNGSRTARALLACAIVAAGVAWAGETPARPKRVLVLSQFEPGLPASISFVTGVRAELDPLAGYDVYLDYLGGNPRPWSEDARNWLRAKHAGAPPDLVVAAGHDSFAFLSDPKSAPWPGVPIVVGMFLPGLAPNLVLPSDVSGVVDSLAVRETIDLALRLLPSSRHLVLVGGTSPLDERFAAILRADAATFAGRLDVIDLIGLPTAALEGRLRQLPDGCIVVVLSYFQDGAGQPWLGQQFAKRASAASRAPMFSTHTTVMGHGVVGGVLIDWETSGHKVGQIVRRVLAGESAATIPLVRGEGTPILDGRQLDRWGVKAARVPAGVEVRFREPTLWSRYRWVVVSGVAGLAFQAVLIGVLLLERRRRRAAETRFRENLAVVSHMSRVGAIGELAGAFAHELNSPLGAVVNNAQAARRFIRAGPERADDVAACLEDIVGDAQRAGEVVRRMRKHLRREDINPAEVDVSAVIRDAVHLIALDARDRGVDVSVDVAEGLPRLMGDDVQLVQVVLNLAMNALDAVQSVPKDRRRVRVSAAPTDGGVEIQVIDTGPGIPPAMESHVFEPFFTTKGSGLGLGLSISRSVVEAHGGRISTSAMEGGGTAFHVVLPAAHRPRTSLEATG